MATAFNATAKNAMLQGLKDWNPGSVGTAMNFGAYTADNDEAGIVVQAGTYGTPTSGAMDITANVVLNIPSGNTIIHMRIQKGTGPTQSVVYKKDVTSMAFTFAGTITVTSGEISLIDPA